MKLIPFENQSGDIYYVIEHHVETLLPLEILLLASSPSPLRFVMTQMAINFTHMVNSFLYYNWRSSFLTGGGQKSVHVISRIHPREELMFLEGMTTLLLCISHWLQVYLL